MKRPTLVVHLNVAQSAACGTKDVSHVRLTPHRDAVTCKRCLRRLAAAR